MTRFKFEGFENRATVEPTLTQAGETVSAGVPAWGQGTAAIAITPTVPDNIVAPAGIWLEATSPSGFTFEDPGVPGYTPAHHEITYIWTIRGNPFPAWTKPVNLLPGWNNANVYYGPKVGIALPSAGSYVIDLWCVKTEGADAGLTATSSYSVTVQDPDTVYAGNKTICFSADTGDTFAGKPAGAQEVTSVSALETAAATTPGPLRVLLKGRQTYTPPIRISLNSNQPVQCLGAWGTGKAIIDLVDHELFRLETGFNQTQFTVTGLDITDDWDSISETGKPQTMYSLTRPENAILFNFHDVDSSAGLGISTRETVRNHVIISDIGVTDFRNYGLYSQGIETSLSIIGSDIRSHPQSMHGGGGKVGSLYNQHGPLRMSRGTDCHIAASSFFSRRTWSVGTDQPCLRIMIEGNEGSYVNLDRVSCEGGGPQISHRCLNNNPNYPGTGLFDKVLLLGTTKQSRYFSACDRGGATWRNVYAFMPDILNDIPGTPQAVFETAQQVPGTFYVDSIQRYYSVTAVSLLSDEASGLVKVTDQPPLHSDTITENCVLHAPNYPTPTDTFAPIDLSSTISGITPRYEGIRWNYRAEVDETDLDTFSGGDVVHNGSFTIPYSGIYEDTWDQAVGTTSATSQSYWQTYEGTDTRHMIYLDNEGQLYGGSLGSDFTVSFDAGGVTITNTSGATWTGAGNRLTLRLDRSSRLPPMRTQYGTTGVSVPYPYPDTGSAALNGDAGMSAYDDILTAVRPSPVLNFDHRGNPVPDSGDIQGAFLVP